MVLIERVSTLSGITHVRAIDMGEQAFTKAHEAWANGTLVQNAFPTLDADDREFIVSGITEDEWSAIYGEE